MSLALRIGAVLAVVQGLYTQGPADAGLEGEDGPMHAAYSFDDFARHFGRAYEKGSEEYAHRSAVFQDSLSQIHAMNSRAKRSWTAGVYPFMDWTAAERTDRLHGYEPAGTRRVAEVALQMDAEAVDQERIYGGLSDSFEAEVPEVRNQGAVCGSCWAHAAVEAVEAQLMKHTSPWPRRQMGEPPRLSVQALLDCVPNPNHCGGSGGCGGATPELAFGFMRDVGLPMDAELPYHPRDTTVCPMEPYPSDWIRVTVASWRVLPRNQAQPLMRALVKDGPVAVAADAQDWPPYRSGVYDGCRKDAILSHSVLVRGYGVNQNGKKYWLLQNSWGPEWGEGGSMRLLRHDDEDHWCGVDRAPQVGVGCASEAHTNVTVCGTCGLLYDAVIPQVDRIVIGDYVYSSSGVSTVRALAAVAAAADALMPMLSGSQIDKFVAIAEVAPPPPPSITSSTTEEPSTTTTEVPHIHSLVAQHSRVEQLRVSYAYDSDDIASDFIRSVSQADPPLTTDVTARSAEREVPPAEEAPDVLPEAREFQRLQMQSLTRDISRSSRFHHEFGSSFGDPPLSPTESTGDFAGAVASEVSRPDTAALNEQVEEPQTDAGTSSSADSLASSFTWPSWYSGGDADVSDAASSSAPAADAATFHQHSMALKHKGDLPPFSAYMRR